MGDYILILLEVGCTNGLGPTTTELLYVLLLPELCRARGASTHSFHQKIEIEIADDSEICSNQSGVFMHTYDGVLALAEMPAGVEGGDLSPFIFLLSGWEQGTEPSGNIDALNSYLPNDVIVVSVGFRYMGLDLELTCYLGVL